MSAPTTDRPQFLSDILDDKVRSTMERLTALQNKHRLALHMFECADGARLYPEAMLKQLHENPAEKIAESFKAPSQTLFSLSLLPSQRSGKSMLPFEEGWSTGYLFDLSADVANPPRVARVFTRNARTGADNSNKHFGFMRNAPKGASDIYNHYHHNLALIKAAIADDISLSEKQLDALGKYYEQWPSLFLPTFIHPVKNIVKHNEVLAAVSNEHIAAIVVSAGNPCESYSKHLNDPRQALEAQYATLRSELMGALAGYEHAQQGMALPVVCYHVLPPNQGQLTYVAQGLEECREKAMAVIRQLQEPRFKTLFPPSKDKYDGRLEMVKRYAELLLDIDITEPLPPEISQQRG